MIVCDKCGALIEEKPPEDLKEDIKEESEEEAPRRKRYKKEAPREEVPVKRISLVTLPYQHCLNGYLYRDFDLCESCRAFLAHELDRVKFGFIHKQEDTSNELR